MNIWCISKYASIPSYGAAARLFYLAKEFSKQCEQVVLITSDSNHLCKFPETESRYNYEEQDGVKVCWIKNIKYNKSASMKRVLSWFDFEFRLFLMDKKKLNKPDVVLISSLSLLSIVYGYYLKKRFGASLIFEIRDIWPLTLIEEGGVSKYHPLSIVLGWLEKFGYKNADLIVGTMPRLDLHVESILGYKKEVFCSPLGIDEHQIGAVLEVPKLDVYFPEGKKIIGYAGSMGISNSLQPFIDIIKNMSEFKELHFVLVGAGDLKDKFKNELTSYDNVTFVPKIKQEEVQYFLNKCDVLYLSTQNSKVWDFGQSMNKVVQYMLSGKPVVASYSGYPSMLNESGSGIFIPADDKDVMQDALIKFAFLNDDERRNLGDKGKEWILSRRMYKTLAEEYLVKIREIENISGQNGR
ncbi:glycosyltransferase family 4 protein [Pseudoalteromonas ostreae]|uniref:glycosyltransferase family 4 protein n=1 Tax=Pseudoalteromonas ostreae TaxID=2774154 RepID=UPI001B379716|nr:glycosyltransferase family 4 protein [Pseudoalteromonas ostreae]